MASFRKLSENLARLAGVPSRIAAPACVSINKLIGTQYAGGQDSYGKAWAKLLPSTVKRKNGDTRILLRTDMMSVSTVASPMRGAGIQLTTLSYGSFHQSGTRHMVSRPIFPARADLPGTWRKAIGDAYSSEFGKAMSRG